LTDSVDVLGAVPHERVVELMREADIYTQHSVTAADGNQEGLPIGLIEATATGLPVVSTWHSGIPDLVMHDETGLLVEERNVEAMGRCIAELAADPERRRAMGRAGRRRVEEHFDLSKQMRKLAGIYEDVCSKKPRNT
jgi:colanic acid/amylovoran biosynthesis glycosyltransferase